MLLNRVQLCHQSGGAGCEGKTMRADFCPGLLYRLAMWLWSLTAVFCTWASVSKVQGVARQSRRVLLISSEQFGVLQQTSSNPPTVNKLKLLWLGLATQEPVLCAFVFLGHSDKIISVSELFYCLSLGVQARQTSKPIGHKPNLSGDIQLTVISLPSVYAQDRQAHHVPEGSLVLETAFLRE